MKLIDATGKNYGQKVNKDNQAETYATTEPADRHINRQNKKVWSLPFDAINPVGADDYFVYLSNTGTKDLAITDIRVKATTTAGTVEVHHVSGTPSYTADTDITPTNRYLGSTNSPSMTAKTDTDTTGLTNEGILFYINCDTVNVLYHLRTTSNIIIPPGQSMALLWDTATGEISGIISVVEVDDL